ncbi:MAG: biotin--[acetyl-CoA-carboxylase] ligase [Oscillibacter sp.]|nr:biotin--[acetyl-CoA-carboxylase] ligase [Oscillibacter sp.]
MSRQAMLALLKAHSNEYISGEAVSQQLGLSRTAIWKSVDVLRKAGYDIEARTGLGYRLVSSPDSLTEEEIRTSLGPVAVVGRDICCFDEIDSTNTYAKKLALQGGIDGTVVVANCQTHGRGRMERSFQSPKDQGIYLTVLLRPTLPPERLLIVTALGAVAMCTAVERVCGVRPQIKWTNDLVINGKKVCGILTEMSLEGESGRLQYLVMGMGLNVLQEKKDFSPEVQSVATSLKLELGRAISRPALAAAEIEEMDKLYAALQSGEIEPYLAAYRRDCVTLGKEVQLLRADGSREHVTALDVDEMFGLVVRRDNGEITVIRSGEASVRGMYGYVE